MLIRSIRLLPIGMLAIASSVFAAGNDCGIEPGCQCHSSARVVCHHHHLCCRPHCRRCEAPPPQRYAPPRDLPPAGPIMETVPMARMMPIMAAPMMMTAMPMQRAAFVEDTVPRVRETTCETSSGRLVQLEQRFELLQQRVDSLQNTISNQTDILVKIKGKLDDLDQRVK